MKHTLILLLIFLTCSQSVLLSQTSKTDLEEEVWTVVEKRNATWKNGDFEGHSNISHPAFMRWVTDSDELLTKENLREFWDSSKVDIRILKLDVTRKAIQFFNEENLAVAHYTIYEEIEYTGEDYKDENYVIKKGEIFKEIWRFSDYYIKEGSDWLYIGGNKLDMTEKD